MADIEHKIRLVTEYQDRGVIESLKKAQESVISFEAAAKKAGKTLKETEDQGAKSSKTLGDLFSNLKTSTAAALAGVAGLTTTIGLIVKEITDAEDATRKFGFALNSSGISSKQAVSNFQAFAKSIQATTRYSDEAVLSLGGLLTSMGVGFKDLQGASQASIELAARFGMTLEEAGSAIARSFGGSARELGRFVPELRGMSEEALRSGKAVDIINKKFAGSAASDSESLSGAIAKARNSLGEIAESMNVLFGPAITGTISLLKQAADAAIKFADAIGLGDKMVTGTKQDQFKAQMEALIKERASLQALATGPGESIDSEGNVVSTGKYEAQKRILQLDKEIAAFKRDILDLERKSTTEIEKQVKEQISAKSQAELASKFDQVEANIKKDTVDLLGKQNDMHGLAIQQMSQLNALSDEEVIKAQRKLEILEKQNSLQDTASAISNVGSGNFTSLIGSAGTGAASAMGLGASAGVWGMIAAAVASLVISAKELPGKIQGFFKDLGDGFADGVFQLAEYLSTDFLTKTIPQFVQKLGEMLGKLLPIVIKQGIQDMFNSVKMIGSSVWGALKGIGTGIVDGFKSLGSMFGGDGPSYFKDFRDAIDEKLDFGAFSKSIGDLAFSIKQAGSSFQTIADRLGISNQGTMAARYDTLIAQRNINSDIAIGKKGDVRIKDPEKFAQHVEELKSAIQDESQAIIDNANLRIEKIRTEKQALIDLNEEALVPIRATLERLRSLKTAVSSAFGSAISAVSGAFLSSGEKSGSLLSQFNAASGEAKGSLGQQLAGALQDQFSEAQKLAQTGAISGEELKRIQADILTQLETSQASATSELDQLIASNEKQEAAIVAASDRLRTEMNQQIEGVKAYAQAQLNRLTEILLQLRNRNFRGYAVGSAYVQETGLAVVHKGETITPYGSKGGITININGVGAQGATKESLVKAVRDILNQNLGNVRGAIARANG